MKEDMKSANSYFLEKNSTGMFDKKRDESRICSENFLLHVEIDRLYRCLEKNQIHIERLEKELKDKNKVIMENSLIEF